MLVLRIIAYDNKFISMMGCEGLWLFGYLNYSNWFIVLYYIGMTVWGT